MSDNPKELEKEMEKAIFIPGDCWLNVFDLLPPFQLGLGIALISHRFDYFVDEHFKTRKWTLGQIEIGRKIGENGANELEIVNSKGKALPIPQNPLPNKVIGFSGIYINYIDQNVLTFLRHFHHFFAKSETELAIATENVRILKFAVLNIWPMFKDTIRHFCFNRFAFHRMRQLAPSILCNCPCLQFIIFNDATTSPEFPADDSANASDGQAMAKWLFSPHLDNLPNVLITGSLTMEQWLATIQQIKAAFSNASSPVAFIICLAFPSSSSLSSVVPFELTNKFTEEKLTLLQKDANTFKLVRCPIAAGDVGKWMKEMKELVRGENNKIGILIGDDGVDKSLLDSLPVPSGQ